VSTFAEIADVIEKLPDRVSGMRDVLGQSLRATAMQMGLPPTVLHKFEKGITSPSGPSLIAILRWVHTMQPEVAFKLDEHRRRHEWQAGWAERNPGLDA